MDSSSPRGRLNDWLALCGALALLALADHRPAGEVQGTIGDGQLETGRPSSSQHQSNQRTAQPDGPVAVHSPLPARS